MNRPEKQFIRLLLGAMKTFPMETIRYGHDYYAVPSLDTQIFYTEGYFGGDEYYGKPSEIKLLIGKDKSIVLQWNEPWFFWRLERAIKKLEKDASETMAQKQADADYSLLSKLASDLHRKCDAILIDRQFSK